MSKGIIYSNKDSAYLSKKHFCPKCNVELKKVKVTKKIDRSSNEFEEMPKMFSRTIVGSKGFKFRNYNYAGDITYIWKEFECNTCHRHFTIKEMKEIEGIKNSETQALSSEEIRKINRKKLIFNKILPIVFILLIVIIHYFVTRP